MQHAVCTDWAIFEGSWAQIFLQNQAKYLETFWLIKNITFYVKTAVATLGQLLQNLGQLCIF